jgi:hypothetical protein
MSVINLRENKEPPISGQHFVCGKFGSSLGQLICFCGDGEIAQARAIGVHTVDHRCITIPPQKEIFEFYDAIECQYHLRVDT